MPGQPSARPMVPPPLPSRGRAATPVPVARATPIPVASRTPIPLTFSPAPIPTLTVVSAAAAEALLASALRGAPDSGPAARTAARVASALSPDERAALTGGPVAHNPALLRTTAGLRLRLELALATVPAPGAPFDGPAAQVLLGEVDAALSQVKAAVDAAEPALAASLHPIRLALMDGGVALAGAHAMLTPEGALAPAAPAATPSSRAATRVLSNVNTGESEPTPVAGRGIWFAFGAVALLVVAHHAYQFATRAAPETLPTLPGAPAGTFVVQQGSSRTLQAQPGVRVDPGELERFTTQEQGLGRRVRELAPGMWIIEPASAALRKQP